MNKLTICILLLTASFNVLSHNVPEQMKKCTLEKNALNRLVCFDKVSQNITHLPNVPVPTKQAKITSVEPPKQLIDTNKPSVSLAPSIKIYEPEEKFGLEHKPKMEELTDKIVANVHSVEKNAFKKYIITLDNGHVWKQSDHTVLKISVGDTVIVKRGSLGSFFMGKEGINKRLRVKRLK